MTILDHGSRCRGFDGCLSGPDPVPMDVVAKKVVLRTFAKRSNFAAFLLLALYCARRHQKAHNRSFRYGGSALGGLDALQVQHMKAFIEDVESKWSGRGKGVKKPKVDKAPKQARGVRGAQRAQVQKGPDEIA